MNEREQRAFKGLELRAATDKAPLGVLVGYAAVFESDSVEFSGWDRPWVERIRAGAFKRTLRELPDVVALWSHDSAKPLGRTPGSLVLEEDAKGLRAEIVLPDTSVARDLVANVRAGIVDSMSFGFVARAVEWVQGNDRDVRTLLDVDLHEVSAVVWPAYPDTSIALRSRPKPGAGARSASLDLRRRRLALL